MNKCLFCKKNLEKEFYENKIGKFCNEEHYDKYLKSLSKEEYIELQHSMCVCSDDKKRTQKSSFFILTIKTIIIKNWDNVIRTFLSLIFVKSFLKDSSIYFICNIKCIEISPTAK